MQKWTVIVDEFFFEREANLTNSIWAPLPKIIKFYINETVGSVWIYLQEKIVPKKLITDP